jgi:hypothetical protein
MRIELLSSKIKTIWKKSMVEEKVLAANSLCFQAIGLTMCDCSLGSNPAPEFKPAWHLTEKLPPRGFESPRARRIQPFLAGRTIPASPLN